MHLNARLKNLPTRIEQIRTANTALGLRGGYSWWERKIWLISFLNISFLNASSFSIIKWTDTKTFLSVIILSSYFVNLSLSSSIIRIVQLAVEYLCFYFNACTYGANDVIFLTDHTPISPIRYLAAINHLASSFFSEHESSKRALNAVIYDSIRFLAVIETFILSYP